MVEQFSASDLCSDGWVVRMWVRFLAATMVLVSFSKTHYHTCFSPPRSKWVSVRAEFVVVWLAQYVTKWLNMWRNGPICAKMAAIELYIWDLCAWWAGVIMYSALISLLRICALYKNPVLLLIILKITDLRIPSTITSSIVVHLDFVLYFQVAIVANNFAIGEMIRNYSEENVGKYSVFVYHDFFFNCPQEQSHQMT